jgi:multiple sugar transport system permease protein
LKNGGYKVLAQWALRLFLLIVLAVMVFPLFMLTANSLMGRQELLETCGAVLADYGENAKLRIFPMYPTLRAYVRLLLDSPEYFTAFWNSMIQTVLVLAGQLLAAVPAAWAFAQFRFPGKKVLWFLYMLLMILPFQVTMVSGYLVLNTMDLMDTRAAVILPGIFSTLPVFILQKTFAGIPRELLEAARIDGAGDLRIFVYMGIPLGMPGIFSILILGFLEYWNAIEQPMTYLKTEALWPLSLYLPQMVNTEIAAAFAASIVTLLPALLLFFYGQDSLEQGIVASGVKA